MFVPGPGMGLFAIVPFLVALGFVAVPVIILVGYLNQRQRTAGLSALAAGRGWVHRPDDDALVDRFGDVLPGREGRRASNSLSGSAGGRPVVAFDYRWTTSTGVGADRDTTSHGRFVVAVESPAVDLDRLQAALRRHAPDVEVTRSVDAVVVVRRSVGEAEAAAWIDAVVAAVGPATSLPHRPDGPQDGPTWVER